MTLQKPCQIWLLGMLPCAGANGVCKSINTACASSNDAIGDAFRSIKFGFKM